MKNLILTSLLFASASALANPLEVNFDGASAKAAFEKMAGVSIERSGEAGYDFRSGKNLVCWKATSALIGADGAAISPDSETRYDCAIRIDENGRTLRTGS